MSFRGHHEHSIDSKDRITIPSAFRAELSSGMVLVAGLDPCIEVYTPTGMTEFEQRYLGGLNPLSSEARKLQRRFFAKSQRAELDSAGRVRLPRHLIEHAKLAGPCVIVGVMNRLEIWSPAEWESEEEEFSSRASEMAESAATPAGESP